MDNCLILLRLHPHFPVTDVGIRFLFSGVYHEGIDLEEAMGVYYGVNLLQAPVIYPPFKRMIM